MWLVVAMGVLGGASACLVSMWAVSRHDDLARAKRARESLGLSAASRAPDGAGRAAMSHGGWLSRRKREEARRFAIERHVPEMIDAVALGMRAGLSFESSFRLYANRFDDELAQACRAACLQWESGLVSRDEALAAMARECKVPVLDRFVSNVVRGLRFGSPMGRVLSTLAQEARSTYRSQLEEKVARAPVKMMVPTAALILPAMLMLVMGPVLLEFL